MTETVDDIIRALSADRTEAENERARELLAAYPMPSDRADDVLNRTELARAFQVSEPTVDRWIAEGVPVLQSGSNGKAYRFRLAEVRAWQLRKDAEEKATEARKAKAIHQMQMELLGGTHNEASEELLSPKARREIYELDSVYRSMALARGELVPRSDVDAVLNAVFGIVRKSINGMPDRLSRDAGLTGRQSEQAVAVIDDILTDLNRELDAFAAAHENEEAALIAAE